MEKKDGPKESKSTVTIDDVARRSYTGADIQTFGRALKSAGFSAWDVGLVYHRTTEAERKTIIETTDRFIEQLVKTWDLLRVRVVEY